MATETDLAQEAAALLKRPYARLVVPETDGTYRGEMLEFPGCIATGDTPAEAIEAVEDVADAWLQSALANHQPIPDPVDNAEFSGRLVLRMPKNLHKKAALLAEHEGVSLNQFIVTCLAEQIGERVRPAQHQITFNASVSQVTNLLGNFISAGSVAAGTGYAQIFDDRDVPIQAQMGVVAGWTTASIGPIRQTG